MVNVRSVGALRDNRNKFAENLAHEFPPQPITASDGITCNRLLFQDLSISVAAAHGDGVYLTMLFSEALSKRNRNRCCWQRLFYFNKCGC